MKIKINQNTNSYLSLYKIIQVIKLEEQNYWSQDDVLNVKNQVRR